MIIFFMSLALQKNLSTNYSQPTNLTSPLPLSSSSLSTLSHRNSTYKQSEIYDKIYYRAKVTLNDWIKKVDFNSIVKPKVAVKATQEKYSFDFIGLIVIFLLDDPADRLAQVQYEDKLRQKIALINSQIGAANLLLFIQSVLYVEKFNKLVPGSSAVKVMKLMHEQIQERFLSGELGRNIMVLYGSHQNLQIPWHGRLCNYASSLQGPWIISFGSSDEKLSLDLFSKFGAFSSVSTDRYCNCAEKNCRKSIETIGFARSPKEVQNCIAKNMKEEVSNGICHGLLKPPKYVALGICGDGILQDSEDCDCGIADRGHCDDQCDQKTCKMPHGKTVGLTSTTLKPGEVISKGGGSSLFGLTLILFAFLGVSSYYWFVNQKKESSSKVTPHHGKPSSHGKSISPAPIGTIKSGSLNSRSKSKT